MTPLRLVLLCLFPLLGFGAQNTPLLSQPGPTFRVADGDLSSPLRFIVYGDQRFTDPANTTATNPYVRKYLVDEIASEHPDAVILNGDVPLSGSVENDYAVYKEGTAPWRAAHLHVFPALGNHEFHGDPQVCLQNWWNTFPQLRNRRWYSAQLGSRVYVVALDSDSSLLPASEQARWLDGQIKGVPATIDFLVITMHHPPVADIQQHIEVSHNPRPNEIALRDYLSSIAPHLHAKILVSAGHIHNYERHELEGVTYLVSGGGGAKPYEVERTLGDLYQDNSFPNYHLVRFTFVGNRLQGEMERVADPTATTFHLEKKDSFDITANPPPQRTPSPRSTR